MFAVIKTGGKQYKVQEGDVLEVEKLGIDKGQKVTFDQVLLIDDDEKTFIGTPFLEKTLVRGEVIENFKDKKVIVFKKKRRKQYRKKRGHRQELARVRVEEIVFGLKPAPEKEKKKPEEKVKRKEPVRKAAPKKAVKPKAIKEEKQRKSEKKAEVKRKTKTIKAKESKVKASDKKKAVTKTAAQTRKPKKTKE
ncbi:MAG: 50S ribosomal protein L21 [Candidatus Aminicenantaceae bacterium]